jgi:hypothetical protein
MNQTNITKTEAFTMYSSEEAIFAVIYLIVYFFLLIYSAFAYIGMSLGGFRMGRKAGMSNPWMFWVPGCNIYALGNLADTSCSLREYKFANYRKKLLTWFIVSMAAIFVWCISLAVVAVAATSADRMHENGYMTPPEYETDAMVVPVLIFLLLTGVFMALYTVYMVFYYIALHKIYKLYAPDGAAGLTVLSVLVSVSIPVIFLVLSGRDPAVAVNRDDDLPPSTNPPSPADMGQSFYSL